MKRPVITRWLGSLALAVSVGLLLAPLPLAAQQSAANSNNTAAKPWKVRVKQSGTYFLTVHATDAPLSQIAADLSQRMKTPVVLSRVMAKQNVTVDFKDMPLESALQLLAPNPYVHYELRGGAPPICREIFLNAYNEPIPVPKLDNRNVSFVITGDTESIDSKDDPLRVSYVNQRLSVNVKKQSLTAVLDRIASALGVNFSMKQDTNDTVDLDFKETPLEDAISYFPPSVHLHVRKDIQRINVVPLLLEFAN
jgi:type II secretory pathway component GspD/PulD (secretin)